MLSRVILAETHAGGAARSVEGRQHDPAPWVLLTPLLAVKLPQQPLVLGQRPHRHLPRAGGDEQEGCHRLGGDAEQHPAVDLGRVVGAGDVVEQEATRDLVRLLAGLAQVGQDDVASAWCPGDLLVVSVDLLSTSGGLRSISFWIHLSWDYARMLTHKSTCIRAHQNCKCIETVVHRCDEAAPVDPAKDQR